MKPTKRLKFVFHQDFWVGIVPHTHYRVASCGKTRILNNSIGDKYNPALELHPPLGRSIYYIQFGPRSV